jgi:hypothetical protein
VVVVSNASNLDAAGRHRSETGLGQMLRDFR